MFDYIATIKASLTLLLARFMRKLKNIGGNCHLFRMDLEKRFLPKPKLLIYSLSLKQSVNSNISYPNSQHSIVSLSGNVRL